MKSRKVLGVADVKAILDAAQAHAQTKGWAVSIAVGVSGVQSHEDVEVGRAGIAALGV